MISISVFDIKDSIGGDPIRPIRDAEHFSEQKVVNHFEEVLETWIYANETSPTGYMHYRIVTDEVLDFKARVKGDYIDQVVLRGTYEVYYHPTLNRVVTLCRKQDAFKASGILEKKMNAQLEKHRFNIVGIIEESTDVRGARFDVEIETVRGVSLRGSNINGTEYYARMVRDGELKGVVVTYDHGERSVTLRVSVDGTLLVYSGLSDYEVLDFVDMLYRI